jgi:hypothetical protein
MGKTMRERGKGVLFKVSCNVSRSNNKEWPTITCKPCAPITSHRVKQIDLDLKFRNEMGDY